jgi:hypothetical protein
MPLSPEWLKLPKRRCDDCGKTYKPVRPRREGEMGFCSDNCRKSYHKHGGAYRKLKAETQKMVERLVRERLQLVEPCEMCKGKGTVSSDLYGMSTTMRKSPSLRCPKCINGGVLTALGRDVFDMLKSRVSVYDAESRECEIILKES